MKAAIAVLVSAGLLSFAGSGAASERGAYRRHYTSPSAITPAQRRRIQEAYDRGEYYEHDSNALPFGSKAWFEQRRREAGG